VLNVATTIAWALALLKVGDWLLRPGQKKAVQKAVESAVLWLEYQRPGRLIGSVRRLRTRTILVWSVSSLVLATILLSHSILPGLAIPLLFASEIVLVLAVTWPLASEVMDTLDIGEEPAKVLARATWVMLRDTFFQFVLSIPAVLLSCGILVALFATNVLQFEAASPVDIHNMVRVLSLFIIAIALPSPRKYVLIFVAPSICIGVAVFAAFCVLLEGLFIVARAIAWRVVEYTGGAWAAVLLLLAVALEIAKQTLGRARWRVRQ